MHFIGVKTGMKSKRNQLIIKTTVGCLIGSLFYCPKHQHSKYKHLIINLVHFTYIISLYCEYICNVKQIKTLNHVNIQN